MRELTTADLDAAAQVILNRPLHLSEAAFVQALDPAAAVAARQGIGGAASEPLAAMLSECRATLDNYTSWHKKAAERTTAAEEALLRRARQLYCHPFVPLRAGSERSEGSARGTMPDCHPG